MTGPSSSASPTLPDPLSVPTRKRSAVWGLFDRKERWSLSFRGRLIVFFGLLLLSAGFLKGIYPFLAVTHRVNADVLVVEGWVHNYAIDAALDEFQSGRYRQVFVTGGPVTGTGGYINDFQTSASVGADRLRKAGLAEEFLQMVPSREMNRDRTYSSATALRDWLREHQTPVKRIHVLTEHTHARRTRLLYSKAFGSDVQVGVIAVPNPDYAGDRWWRYSEGVKDVISESSAYLYARFLFSPQES
jgi:uncharacterized SAM-binding protein YcdF (DUF218 family)